MCCLSRIIADFSKLLHSVIYDERFRGSCQKLFADSHLLFFPICCKAWLVQWWESSHCIQEGSGSNLRNWPFFVSQLNLGYSEIYSEQLTSEHFLLYNYRSSTLRRISRNIGRLLRQCRKVLGKKCYVNIYGILEATCYFQIWCNKWVWGREK